MSHRIGWGTLCCGDEVAIVYGVGVRNNERIFEDCFNEAPNLKCLLHLECKKQERGEGNYIDKLEPLLAYTGADAEPSPGSL
jgi:hypothetical protein